VSERVGRDRLEVTLQFREGMGDSPDEIWLWDASGVLEDAELPLREVRQFIAAEEVWPYEIERRESIRNWGASGAAEFILIGVSTGLLTKAIEPAARALFARIGAALSSSQTPWAMTDDQAEQRARWYVVMHFELDDDALALTSTERDLQDEAWKFVFEDQQHRYTVDLEWSDGLVAFSKIRRDAL
jgi:hypothetical protein